MGSLSVVTGSADEANARIAEGWQFIAVASEAGFMLSKAGETAKALKLMLPKAHLATVYAKPAGRPLVDTFVTEVSQDTWIFFPWDLEPQPSTPIIGQR